MCVYIVYVYVKYIVCMYIYIHTHTHISYIVVYRLFKTILLFPTFDFTFSPVWCLTSRQSVELIDAVIDADVLILIIVLGEQSG